MRSVEVTAKTLEEAKQEAAAQLGVTVDEISVEVIEEPHRLLGLIGGGDYHIRAAIASEAAEAAPEAMAQPEAAEPSEQEPSDQGPSEPEASPAAPAPMQTSDEMPALAEEARNILQHIVDLMELPGTVVHRGIEGRDIFLEVQGDDLGALIGRHGATLDALQLLVSVGANNVHHVGGRIVVDAEKYRERRQQMLEKMAITEAEKVKKSGRELVIPDLKPYERRIVHMTLKDDPDVETYSEGEGEQRQLVITPKG